MCTVPAPELVMRHGSCAALRRSGTVGPADVSGLPDRFETDSGTLGTSWKLCLRVKENVNTD